MKDIADVSVRAQFTAVGTGCVAINAVMRSATELGVDWTVVEQDQPNRLTAMESVQASLLSVKE